MPHLLYCIQNLSALMAYQVTHKTTITMVQLEQYNVS
jgi:hypothetical protein